MGGVIKLLISVIRGCNQLKINVNISGHSQLRVIASIT